MNDTVIAAGANADYLNGIPGMVDTARGGSVNTVTGLPTNPLSFLEVNSNAQSEDETQSATGQLQQTQSSERERERERAREAVEAPGVLLTQSWAKLRDLQRATETGAPPPPTSFLDSIVSRDRLDVERD